MVVFKERKSCRTGLAWLSLQTMVAVQRLWASMAKRVLFKNPAAIGLPRVQGLPILEALAQSTLFLLDSTQSFENCSRSFRKGYEAILNVEPHWISRPGSKVIDAWFFDINNHDS